jgi:hypothetical protein
MASCQQRETEAGLHEALLRGEAVDRRPFDLAEPLREKQSEYMGRGDLAASAGFRKCDPALIASSASRFTRLPASGWSGAQTTCNGSLSISSQATSPERSAL